MFLHSVFFIIMSMRSSSKILGKGILPLMLHACLSVDPSFEEELNLIPSDGSGQSDGEENDSKAASLDSSSDADTGHSETVHIDFDDFNPAPTLFIDSSGPLRDRYAGVNVLFSGQSANDGAGILNYTTWQTNGGSLPNFLGLNCRLAYRNGGVPCGDVFILLDFPATKIEFLSASNYDGLQLTATGRNHIGDIVAQTECPTQKSLQLCSLVGSNIVEVTLSMSPNRWYGIDDLQVSY